MLNYLKRQIKESRWKAIGLLIGIPIAFVLSLPLIATKAPPRLYMDRVRCYANLAMLSSALHMYATDNDGWFPYTGGKAEENLSPLMHTYITGTLRCLGSKEKTDSYMKDPSTIGYFYIPGLNINALPDTIIAGDKSFENHSWKGRNVLYVDGRVEWQEPPCKPYIRDLERRLRNYKIAMPGAVLAGAIIGYYLRRKRKKK